MAEVNKALSVSPTPVRVAYLDALLRGDVIEAREIVVSACQDGLGFRALYLEVFQEALYELGRMWENGRATIAQEHLATATTQALMARLSPGAGSHEAGPRRAVVSATDEELHALGSRFVADFLEAEGWRVAELGAATPVGELAQMADQLGAELVCLSTTLVTNLPRARDTISALRALPQSPLIAVGGQAYRGDGRLAETIGADLFAADAGSLTELLGRR